jgi:hypothetical protein
MQPFVGPERLMIAKEDVFNIHGMSSNSTLSQFKGGPLVLLFYLSLTCVWTSSHRPNLHSSQKSRPEGYSGHKEGEDQCCLEGHFCSQKEVFKSKTSPFPLMFLRNFR